MKKRYLYFSLLFLILLSGCSSINNILYPNVGKGELYYNKIKTITKQSVDNGVYNDLFLNIQIINNMPQKTVYELDKREKTGESLNYIDLKPMAVETDRLGTWLGSSTFSYGFNGLNRDSNKVLYYMIKNAGKSNQYIDYLHVMRALTIKYGECTSEIYRKTSGTIISVISKQTDKTGVEMINTFSEAFSNNEIMVSSRWITTDYNIKVDFKSPTDCSVTYEFKY